MIKIYLDFELYATCKTQEEVNTILQGIGDYISLRIIYPQEA